MTLVLSRDLLNRIRVLVVMPMPMVLQTVPQLALRLPAPRLQAHTPSFGSRLPSRLMLRLWRMLLAPRALAVGLDVMLLLEVLVGAGGEREVTVSRAP